MAAGGQGWMEMWKGGWSFEQEQTENAEGLAKLVHIGEGKRQSSISNKIALDLLL